jgi:hypothetical protein
MDDRQPSFGLPFRHHPEPGEHDHTQTDEHHRGYAAAILGVNSRSRSPTKASNQRLGRPRSFMDDTLGTASWSYCGLMRERATAVGGLVGMVNGAFGLGWMAAVYP